MRPVGAASVHCLVHWLPSHAHVSLTAPGAKGRRWSPPKRIVFPTCESNTIAAAQRRNGTTVEVRCTQLFPSHSHVSFSRPWPLLKPPNSTTRLRTESKAIEAPYRAGGEVVGKRWVHVEPSYVQVVASEPNCGGGPSRTIWLCVESYAIDASGLL